MKNIFKLMFCFLLVACSSNDENLLEDITFRGGFVKFEETPTLSFNLEEIIEQGIDQFSVMETLIDFNANATGYTVTAIYDDVEIEDFFVSSSFPAEMSIPVQSILDAFGLTVDDLTFSTKFRFVATVTTPDADYSGLTPDFDHENNVEDGGNTAINLLGPGYLNAMDFKVSFFIPPPPALRYTSFEEPDVAGGGIHYRKAGGVTASEVLLNHPGEPIVNYVANGTSSDDELGFSTEYIYRDGDLGFVDEEIGVTDLVNDFPEYPDGNAGYQLEDVDGLLRISFDEVVVPAEHPLTGIYIQAFFRSTSWESSDSLHIYAEVEDSNGGIATIDVIDISGSQINSREGNWNIFETELFSNIRSYKVFIDAVVNSGSEDMFFDNLIIALPEE